MLINLNQWWPRLLTGEMTSSPTDKGWIGIGEWISIDRENKNIICYIIYLYWAALGKITETLFYTLIPL